MLLLLLSVPDSFLLRFLFKKNTQHKLKNETRHQTRRRKRETKREGTAIKGSTFFFSNSDCRGRCCRSFLLRFSWKKQNKTKQKSTNWKTKTRGPREGTEIKRNESKERKKEKKNTGRWRMVDGRGRGRRRCGTRAWENEPSSAAPSRRRSVISRRRPIAGDGLLIFPFRRPRLFFFSFSFFLSFFFFLVFFGFCWISFGRVLPASNRVAPGWTEFSSLFCLWNRFFFKATWF